jgi:choline transport protein
MGGIIQGLVIVNRPDYEAPAWHLFLIAIAVIVSINVFNVYGVKLLSAAQNPLMFIHVSAFVVIIAILWARAPLVSAREVFVDFENLGGWSSTGLALSVGQISAIFGLMYSDAGAHMSEEVQDSATSVPRSMFFSYVINGILGLILVITFLFALPSVDDGKGFLCHLSIGYNIMGAELIGFQQSMIPVDSRFSTSSSKHYP